MLLDFNEILLDCIAKCYLILLNGYVILLNGLLMLQNGYLILPNGRLILQSGYVILLNGRLILQTGYVILLNGRLMLQNGYVILLNGRLILQNVNWSYLTVDWFYKTARNLLDITEYKEYKAPSAYHVTSVSRLKIHVTVHTQSKDIVWSHGTNNRAVLILGLSPLLNWVSSGLLIPG